MTVTFKPGPTQAPIVETPPKGKARPSAKAPARPVSTRSLKPQISGMLMTINLVLVMIPPLRPDMLDDIEIESLARGLDEQARQSPRFRKALETALAAGSGGTLMGLTAIIGARRAIRHGLLPGGAESDQALGNLLAMGLNAPKVPDVGAA